MILVVTLIENLSNCFHTIIHCVTKLAIQNALRFSNQFCSLKNTQNYIFNFIVDYVILVSVRLLHCIKLVVCDISKLKRQIKRSVNQVLIHNKVKIVGTIK